ncbi:hypothetical protein EV196_102124 [Mariniflexile fucanivorans]|uniref:Uncharacterized protein n=1 Tax=Mariniflexile fucanivorans TaxID=264023 RepID=A0A4R1RMR1_9FLAO|nr:GNAT family N-acetyltransferase [Mariniflexile fucanivorans]TCL67568.1 hypothetical protein EV196_102124 [Mariniflexile fucanivorans]
MEIKHTDNEAKGVFYIEKEGERVAEMTYLHEKPNKIIIDHTEVSETLKGKGVGYKLIEASVQYMRDNNLKVNPTCSFAKAIFDKKHEEYSDVLS